MGIFGLFFQTLSFHNTFQNAKPKPKLFFPLLFAIVFPPARAPRHRPALHRCAASNPLAHQTAAYKPPDRTRSPAQYLFPKQINTPERRGSLARRTLARGTTRAAARGETRVWGARASQTQRRPPTREGSHARGANAWPQPASGESPRAEKPSRAG